MGTFNLDEYSPVFAMAKDQDDYVAFRFAVDWSNADINAANTGGGLIKAGTSSAPVTEDTANMKFISLYFDNGATSGDNRGMYLRLYLTGTGGGGEAARIFTTANNVTVGTAHGAHISLNFGTTGKLTGLGVAMRATLHIPNQAMAGGGNYAAVQAEIWSDGANSDPAGMTNLAFIRAVNGGNASGVADVDDDANLLFISGGAIGAGNMVQADVDETKFSHKIRCNVHGTTMYIMMADS
jgi:hypothetical protein